MPTTIRDPWLNDLVTQLESDGVATLNVDLFASTKAVVPILASGRATLQLIRTGGMAPDNTQNSTLKPAYIRPSAQLTARANNYEEAFEMAEAAYLSLYKVRNQFINSGWYQSIKPLQEPFDGGVDERKQAMVQFNVTAVVSNGRVMS